MAGKVIASGNKVDRTAESQKHASEMFITLKYQRAEETLVSRLSNQPVVASLSRLL